MDGRKTGGISSSIPGKRPRSQTPTSSDAASKPKRSKKPKSKPPRSRADSVSGDSHTHRSSHSHHHSASATATPEGERLTRLWSTLTPQEQSRWTAFQQSVLSTTAVQDWLAACLSRRYNHDDNSNALADYCVPGQEQDIGMVVATLAKIYAQRLVATAVKLRDDNNNNNKKTTTEAAAAASSAVVTPLEPLDIQRAWQYQQKHGLTPGFFLSSSSSSNTTTSSRHNPQAETDLRMAALQAEQEYDAWKQKQQTEEPQQMDEEKATTSTAASPDDNAMTE